MNDLIEVFKNHFSKKADYIKIIRDLKHQRENWFLVEIIKSLEDNKIKLIDQYSYGGVKGKIDIFIEHNNQNYFIELKHYVVEDRSQPYPLRSYLKKGNKQYYENDLIKLGAIAKKGNANEKPIFLIFLTGSINKDDKIEVAKFMERQKINDIYLTFNYESLSDDLTILWFDF